MKIAFLSFYSGKVDRGVEVATAALARLLSGTHEVTVFQAGADVQPNIPTVILPVENRWPEDKSGSFRRIFYLDYYSFKIALFTLRFIPFFAKARYDVVIATNGGWQTFFIRILTFLNRKTLIVQGNAGIGWDDLWQLLLRPDCFIAISPQGYAWAKQKMPRQKLVYIPYGVDLQTFANAKPAKVGLRKPIVICVAAFVAYKRIELLIRAVAKTREASLLVIGNGPLEQKLRTLGATLLHDRFLLLTGISHQELPAYYKAGDVFSLPSAVQEAFGIVYVEALAAGLPVVAPNDQNRRQVIGPAGFYVRVEDEIAYARAIETALKDADQTAIRQQAEKYRWETIGKQYLDLLKTFKMV